MKISEKLILNVAHHGRATKKIFNSRSYGKTSDLHLVPEDFYEKELY